MRGRLSVPLRSRSSVAPKSVSWQTASEEKSDDDFKQALAAPCALSRRFDAHSGVGDTHRRRAGQDGRFSVRAAAVPGPLRHLPWRPTLPATARWRRLLKVEPADLTGICIRARGTFPANQVVEIIRYGGNLAGHGTMPGHGAAVMPVWGRVFSEEGGGGKGGGAFSRRAVIELKRYLESIQRMAP